MKKRFDALLSLVYASIALIFAIVFLVSYKDYHDDSTLRRMLGREIHSYKLYADILHFDEVLTMSARMAAATGQPQWEQRYLHYEPLLDAAIKEVIREYPDTYEELGAKQIDDTNVKMVDIEKRALALARRGKLKEASALMNGSSYERLKSAYADGMTIFLDKTVGRAESGIKDTAQEILERVILVAAACFLLLINIFVLKKAQSLIDQQQKSQQELSRNKEDMQMIIDEQTHSLRAAKDRAENANKAKTNFLTNISHELRTPMHAILGFTNLGLKNAERWNKEENSSNLMEIKGSAERLLELINDLLDLSRLEAGKVIFTPTSGDIAALLAGIADGVAPLASDKKQTIHLAHPEAFFAEYDALQIRQVITNLLSNAIKFSPEGSAIILDIVGRDIPSGRRKADVGTVPGLMVSVADQGIGIPEDELGAVFDKFVQSSKTRGDTGGTGLGLAICRQIINRHRGDIWAEHSPSGGARFCFTLPLKQPKRA